MLKYTTYDIVFQEIPGETTLAINISNCPHQCLGCHSPELWEDIGDELTMEVFLDLLKTYSNITCVCFMGGDSNIDELFTLINNFQYGRHFINGYDHIKVAWYSGRTEVPEFNYPLTCETLNYIKLGPYIEKLGPLNSPTTNQRLYKIEGDQLIDITNKFWKSLS